MKEFGDVLTGTAAEVTPVSKLPIIILKFVT